MYHVFLLLITGYFRVLYYTGQNRSGFKVFKLKSASLQVYTRPLCKINAGYHTWGFTFSEFLSFILLFVLHLSALYNEISGMLLSLEL